MPYAKASLCDTGGNATVQVRFAWNGWQSVDVRLDELEDIHWRHPHGAPCALVHAYVPRARVTASAPRAGAADARVLVCVLKRWTPAAIYAALMARAGQVA